MHYGAVPNAHFVKLVEALPAVMLLGHLQYKEAAALAPHEP